MPSYSTSDINKFRGSSLLLGVGRGVHDNPVDITYSDKNDEKDEKIKDLEININLRILAASIISSIIFSNSVKS